MQKGHFTFPQPSPQQLHSNKKSKVACKKWILLINTCATFYDNKVCMNLFHGFLVGCNSLCLMFITMFSGCCNEVKHIWITDGFYWGLWWPWWICVACCTAFWSSFPPSSVLKKGALFSLTGSVPFNCLKIVHLIISNQLCSTPWEGQGKITQDTIYHTNWGLLLYSQC